MADQEDMVHVLLAVFDREDEASGAMQALGQTSGTERIALMDAAAVLRDAHSQLHVALPGPQSRDDEGTRAGVAMAVLGLIFPTTALVASGAAPGGSYSRFLDRGVSNEDLETAGRCLLPGQSILIAVARAPHANRVARDIRGYTKLDEYLLNTDSGAMVAA